MRLLLLASLFTQLLLLPAAAVQAQDSPSPAVAQRMLRIIERYMEEPQRLLEELDRLASNRGMRSDDRGFVRREQAALLIREDRNEEARELLAEALAGQPADYVPSLRLLYGQLLLMNNDASGAMEQLRIWSQQVTDPHPVELSLLGYAYLQLEQFDSAVTTFERVLAVADIINEQWYEVLAYAYTQSGRGEDAVALLDRIIAEQPQEARWWRQLGNIFMVIEQYPAGAASFAVADLVEALSFEDGRRLAGLLSMLNMPAEGAEVLAQTMDRFPERRNYEDQMLLGELWMLARETEAAIAAFQAAVPMATDGEPALKISQLHLQWERYEPARDALRDAVDLYGEATPEEVWYLLAVVEINLNNLSAASAAIGRLDPQGDYAERGENLDRFIDNRLAATQ